MTFVPIQINLESKRQGHIKDGSIQNLGEDQEIKVGGLMGLGSGDENAVEGTLDTEHLHKSLMTERESHFMTTLRRVAGLYNKMEWFSKIGVWVWGCLC